MLTATLPAPRTVLGPALAEHRHAVRAGPGLTTCAQLDVHPAPDPDDPGRVLRLRPAEIPTHVLPLRFAPPALRADVQAIAETLSITAFPDAWIVTPTHFQGHEAQMRELLDDFLEGDFRDRDPAARFQAACDLGFGGLDPAYLQAARADHARAGLLTPERAAAIPDERLRRIALLTLACARHTPPLELTAAAYAQMQLSFTDWAPPTAVLDPARTDEEARGLLEVLQEAFQAFMEDDGHQQFCLTLPDTALNRRRLRPWKRTRDARIRHAERIASLLRDYLEPAAERGEHT